MARIPKKQVEQLLQRFAEVEARMIDTGEAREIIALSKEHAQLAPIVEIALGLTQIEQQLNDLEELDKDEDGELLALAQEEKIQLQNEKKHLEHKLQLGLLPKDVDDEAECILEIRAGTGGGEAALFAGDLLRMYERYAAGQGWKVELSSASPGEMGGYKEVICEISGSQVFGKLKWESGTHRVQRVPETESGGRVHTSAATVAVLPKPTDVEIQIRPEDLRIDTMRASGAGGQHVNTTDSAVRITHLPSAIVVTSSEKSQHQNRAIAMRELKTRLYHQQREEKAKERAADRKDQVGSGDRSERIRTYNFPQGRLTDHRINLTLYKLTEILEGAGLDEVITALMTEDQARKLAQLEMMSEEQ